MAKAKILREYVFRENEPMIVGVKIIEGTFYENDAVWYNGRQYTLMAIQQNAEGKKFVSEGMDAAFQVKRAKFSKKCLEIIK